MRLPTALAHPPRAWRLTLRTLLLAALGIGLASADATLLAQPPSAAPKARVELVPELNELAPGSEAKIAAVVTIEPKWHLQSHTPSFDYLIPTILKLQLPEGWDTTDVQYPPHRMWEAGFADGELLAVYEEEAVLVATVQVPQEATGEATLAATLEYQACDDRVCLPPTEAIAQVSVAIGTAGMATAPELFRADRATPAPPTNQRGLFAVLALAVLGGLILNAMPCVLPVLSLKIFGLVQAGGQGKSHVVRGAIATSLGILVSFWILAAATLVARSAGEAIGWGIQFQNPLFVTFLGLVVLLFSLNMWGLFEISLPSFISRRLGGGSGESGSSHFASGMFATLMATPCSAPFLGTAVGFALSQSALVIVVAFSAIAVGMALPYLLLAVAPSTASWLPRPGEWMNRLRGVMGFLLAGTAVWLFYVLAAQIQPESVAFLQVTFLAIALFAWLLGSVARQGGSRRLLQLGLWACVVGALYLASTARPLERGAETAASGRIAWVPFDEQQAIALSNDGQYVFVDVTADWCVTCKVNERLVLETDPTGTLFEEHDVVAMKADWTNRNEVIANYLAAFGRYAIPFYALYRPGGEVHVFGEVLTYGSLESAFVEGVVAGGG